MKYESKPNLLLLSLNEKLTKEERYIIVSHVLYDYTLNEIATELNENLNKYSVDQFLNYLDLDINISNGILNLDRPSYKKLEDSYIKELKKVRC